MRRHVPWATTPHKSTRRNPRDSATKEGNASRNRQIRESVRHATRPPRACRRPGTDGLRRYRRKGDACRSRTSRRALQNRGDCDSWRLRTLPCCPPQLHPVDVPSVASNAGFLRQASRLFPAASMRNQCSTSRAAHRGRFRPMQASVARHAGGWTPHRTTRYPSEQVLPSSSLRGKGTKIISESEETARAFLFPTRCRKLDKKSIFVVTKCPFPALARSLQNMG